MSDDVRYLDANVMLGPGEWTGEGPPTTREALIEAMDHFGIHQALVREGVGEIGSAAHANERVLERTSDNPRLLPVWMLLPPYTHESPPPEEMVAQMRERGVAAAWFSHGAFGLPLEKWVFGDMLAPLAEARVPVFFSPIDARQGEGADQADWSGLVRVCQAFPDLPVIATEARVYKGQRAMWAALATCPNLHIDISILWPSRSVDYLCREFGPERLVFGTQLPRRTPGAVLMQLNYAGVSPEALAKIAGGNMRELASWNGKTGGAGEDVVFPEPEDALHRAARERADLSGERFYDCHGHVGRRNQRHVCLKDVDELVEEMDKSGVRQCCVFALLGNGGAAVGNDVTFEAVRRFPDRFIGFTWINPNHGVEAAQREFKRGMDHGMRGVKMLSGIHSGDYGSETVEAAIAFADQHGLFVLNHTWGPEEGLRQWLEKYPNVCYITGHSAGNYGELIRDFPNLYICTCPFLRWGQTEDYVQRFGADRLLFGSDLQDLPIGWGQGPIFYARISEAEKRLILGGNLERLLEVYGKV